MISASETPQSAARQLAAKVLARGFKPEELHEYRAADGTPIYWRIRAKRDDGEKWIRPMMLNGHGYELKEPEFPDGKKPLYNLDRIAADPSSLVWIVEGEKPANALTKLGAVATTSGGATSAADADWSVLAGRDCRVWPDNDEAGEKYAVSVVGILQALGCRISGVDVDRLNLPPKGDAVEWLQSRQNTSLSDLQELPLLAYQAAAPNAIAGDLEGDEWPEPQPLPHELPAVESFTLNLLPEALRPWIGDVSERVQCPPDFPAVAAMVALGSVLGRRVGILPKRFDSWREYPNLWGAIVGRPGVLKSPALREALRPLRELESEAATEHQSEMQAWTIERAEAEIKRRAGEQNALKAAKQGMAFSARDFAAADDEEEPAMRRFVVNDSMSTSVEF